MTSQPSHVQCLQIGKFSFMALILYLINCLWLRQPSVSGKLLFPYTFICLSPLVVFVVIWPVAGILLFIFPSRLLSPTLDLRYLHRLGFASFSAACGDFQGQGSLESIQQRFGLKNSSPPAAHQGPAHYYLLLQTLKSELWIYDSLKLSKLERWCFYHIC